MGRHPEAICLTISNREPAVPEVVCAHTTVFRLPRSPLTSCGLTFLAVVRSVSVSYASPSLPAAFHALLSCAPVVPLAHAFLIADMACLPRKGRTSWRQARAGPNRVFGIGNGVLRMRNALRAPIGACRTRPFSEPHFHAAIESDMMTAWAGNDAW
jgi:hypothetical protein